MEFIFVGRGFVFGLLWAYVVDPFLLTMHGWFSRNKTKKDDKRGRRLMASPNHSSFPPCWLSLFLPWLTFLLVLPFTNPTLIHPLFDDLLYLYNLHSRLPQQHVPSCWASCHHLVALPNYSPLSNPPSWLSLSSLPPSSSSTQLIEFNTSLKLLLEEMSLIFTNQAFNISLPSCMIRRMFEEHLEF